MTENVFKEWLKGLFTPYWKMSRKKRLESRLNAIPLWILYIILQWNFDYALWSKIVISSFIIVCWTGVIIFDYKKYKKSLYK